MCVRFYMTFRFHEIPAELVSALSDFLVDPYDSFEYFRRLLIAHRARE